MKKIFSALLTVCMLLGCLSACGSKNPSTSDDGSATTGAKDTIVFAQASDITSLDFHVGKNPATYDVTCNIFDTLKKMATLSGGHFLCNCDTSYANR